jgi:hypothetical protein
MKKMMVGIFFLVSTFIWASDLADAVLDGYLMGINSYLIHGNNSREDRFWKFSVGIFKLDKKELRLLRNTIYAKHGYKFNSPDLQRHFSQFSWYNGTKMNVEAELTELDKENIRLIQKIEVNYPNLPYENLSGCWIIPRDLWNEIDGGKISPINHLPFFNIYSNGTFYISMEGGNFPICYHGLWKIENNTLVLNYLFENEHFLELPTFTISDNITFGEIVSPNDKEYISCRFFKYTESWIKISDDTIPFDK